MTDCERLTELLDEYTENLSARDLHKSEFSEMFAKFLLKNGVCISVKCKDCEHYIASCKICKKLSGLKMTIPEFGCVLGKRREG